MSYQRDRDNFIARMTKEGVPLAAIETVLRGPATIQGAAELECSTEAAYNDRVNCPAYHYPEKPCLCESEGTKAGDDHGTIPRYALRSHQAETRIEKAVTPFGVVPIFSGDPRGACVKLKVRSGFSDSWGGEGLCVPTRS